MGKITIQNAKTAEYRNIDLNNLFDPETKHKQSFGFGKATVSQPQNIGGQLFVSFYTLQPGDANYPYHYHTSSEELYYIISGTGTLTTPSGDKTVREGDVIMFPVGAGGAHQLINTSDAPLVYLDVDTATQAEVVFYPNKGDFSIITPAIRKNFSLDSEVNYLRNE